MMKSSNRIARARPNEGLSKRRATNNKKIAIKVVRENVFRIKVGSSLNSLSFI